MVDPCRYGRLIGSITTRTPCESISTSSASRSVSNPIAYWNPEQPPPSTARRSTCASGSSAASAFTRSAAISVRLTIGHGLVELRRDVLAQLERLERLHEHGVLAHGDAGLGGRLQDRVGDVAGS